MNFRAHQPLLKEHLWSTATGIGNTYPKISRPALSKWGRVRSAIAMPKGWEPGDMRPEHRFLRVNGGFLGIVVDRENNVPFIQFRHYDVNGAVMNEEKFS